jgi:hypothetical protein
VIDVCFDFAVVELYGTDADEELAGSLHLRVAPVVDGHRGITIRTMVAGSVHLANDRVIVGVGFRALRSRIAN